MTSQGALKCTQKPEGIFHCNFLVWSEGYRQCAQPQPLLATQFWHSDLDMTLNMTLWQVLFSNNHNGFLGFNELGGGLGGITGTLL